MSWIFLEAFLLVFLFPYTFWCDKRAGGSGFVKSLFRPMLMRQLEVPCHSLRSISEAFKALLLVLLVSSLNLTFWF